MTASPPPRPSSAVSELEGIDQRCRLFAARTDEHLPAIHNDVGAKAVTAAVAAAVRKAKDAGTTTFARAEKPHQ